jgi:DNA-binding beta-propeller fold protein YncE
MRQPKGLCSRPGLVIAATVCAAALLLSLGRVAPAATGGAHQPTASNGTAALRRALNRPLLGGDLTPVRCVMDHYPEFSGVAVDPDHDVVAFSDFNLKSLLLYRRTANVVEDGITQPLTQIIGPDTRCETIGNVAVDPVRREVYTLNADTGDSIMAFPYSARGDASPRTLAVPHGAFAAAINQRRKEIAVSSTAVDIVTVYRLGSAGLTHPIRYIRGAKTGLAVPWGIFWDQQHNEIGVANDGNWWEGDFGKHSARDLNLVRLQGAQNEPRLKAEFRPPSIRIYSGLAQGDVPPLRVIQGPKTRLDWPRSLAVDTAHNLIAVANLGDNSVLIFAREASGDVAPLRIIHGPHTGIRNPTGIAIDSRNSEIWVANFGHQGEAFDLNANGDVAPKRIIRNAPPGTPVVGTNSTMALGYDSKRNQLLVPN